MKNIFKILLSATTVLLCAAAFSQSIQKFPLKPYMAWGPNGNFGTGSQAYLDTFSNKHGNILGRAWVCFDGHFDPRNKQFDADTLKPGLQHDSTTPLVTRPLVHDFWDLGNGSQICVVLDVGRVMYWKELWWNDQTGNEIPNAVEVFIGSLEEIRSALFQFRLGTSVTPDHVLNCSSSRGWKSITNMKDTGQFAIFRFNKVNGIRGMQGGANFTSFVPYGYASPYGTKDTRITPDFSMPLKRDTTLAVYYHSGLVEAHPTPPYRNYWSDTLTWFFSKGGYIGNFGSPQGVIDKDTRPWRGAARSNNKIDLQPYGSPLYEDSTFVRGGLRWAYQVDKSPNGRLLQQINYASTEHIPIDSAGADPRLPSSYGRYAFQFIANAAKLGYEMPNISVGYGRYLTPARYANDAFPGRFAWGRIKYFIPFNENWAGYRNGRITGSNYMSPMALFSFHDTLRTEWKKLFANTPFVSQGFAAWGIEGIIEAEFLGRVWYMDTRHPIADILNLHTTISTWVFDIDKGCEGNTGSQGVFPGQRGERAKLQAFIDTMYYVSRIPRRVMITEFSYGSSKNYVKPVGCDFISGLSAKKIKHYRPHESQGIMKLHARAHYEAVQGVEGVWDYEFGDAADSAGIYYNNIDANNGNYNGFRKWYKAGHFILQQHNKWLKDYRVVSVVADSLNGQFTTLYQHIAKRDSFCLFTTWQNYADAPSARKYVMAPDVTQVTRKTHLWPDFSMNGKTIATTVRSGTVWLIPRPEGDYVFFRSTQRAASLRKP
ncbi:MAG TPA: hypothetical protein VD993_13200 [Chitinophagaceae bacterium]|nr:hypothetical protein [Chitinophagaceae bacterium]